MIVRLISSGKSAVLSGQINADLYIDCRVVVNPHRDPEVGHLTGDDHALQAWLVKNNAEVLRSWAKIIELGLTTAPTRNSFKVQTEGLWPSGYKMGEQPGPKPFTVCFFCLAGVHRSRGSKHVVGNILKQRGHTVEVVK